MFILKKGHQPGVYVPLRALFLVFEKVCFSRTINRLKVTYMFMALATSLVVLFFIAKLLHIFLQNFYSNTSCGYTWAIVR